MNETRAGGPKTTARTATFLFTDIEGSTRLWQEQRAAMAVALEAHDGLLGTVVERSAGTVVKTTGDGLLAAFDRPADALAAAIDAQQALHAQRWPTTEPLRVRMAIHSGTADQRDGDFFGPTLNRAARLLAIGHGSQVLVSGVTAALVADDLPAMWALMDLGEHRLRDLDRPEHVYQLVAPGLPRAFPALRSVSPNATNLPVRITSFVGRQRELADIARLLEGHRLVTLVGSGGTGKTRLALEAAAARLDHHRDGTWLVELAPLADPGLVAAEIARALRVQAQPGQPVVDTLMDYLRAKDLLLILDNCEHVIGTVADLGHALLASCPTLTILASSREALGVEGEALFAVPSLGLPPPIDDHGVQPFVDGEEMDQVRQSEAVALFVERAQATLPEFALDPSNVGPIVEICRRLDGIPLALELAAARVNVLSVAEIAQGLGDRFRLLTGGRRTAVPRQRTLQALIDWSWDLLDDDDRRLLRRLSVFAGGWTLEAATAVTYAPLDGGDGRMRELDGSARLATLDGLGRLVDRSLVAVDHAHATRYRMLETIRQYAADQLAASGETVVLRDRHLGVYRSLALDAQAGLAGADMPAWLARIDTEIDNTRAALDWSSETDPTVALEMWAALTRYWRSRAMGTGALDRMLDAIERVRALPAADTAAVRRTRAVLLARTLADATQLANSSGRANAAALGEEALAAARDVGDPAAIASAIGWLVAVSVLRTDGRDIDAWRSLADEAMRLATESGDWARLGSVQSMRAMIESAADPAAAERWAEQASDAVARSGNPQEIATVSQIRGRVASRAGRLSDAQHWFRLSQAQFHAIGDRRFELSAQSELAHALRRSGSLDAAEAELRQTIHGWMHSGNRGAVANQLESFAFLALERGKGDRAARLLGAAEAIREGAGAPMTAFERGEYDGAVGRLRAQLDAASFSDAWAAGRGLTLEQAVALALGS